MARARTEQMRLRPVTGDRGAVYLDIEIPDRLREKLAALSLSQRLQVAMRLPEALEQLVDPLTSLDELSNLELAQRAMRLERDQRALAEVRARRQQCPECGVHRSNGHLFGCANATPSMV